MILGASTGFVFGVTTWWITGMILRAVREYRINRHFFVQDSFTEDNLAQDHSERDA
jgi:hypothetical protein